MACPSINCGVHGCDDCSVNDGAGTPTSFGTAVAGTTVILATDISNLRNALDAELFDTVGDIDAAPVFEIVACSQGNEAIDLAENNG